MLILRGGMVALLLMAACVDSARPIDQERARMAGAMAAPPKVDAAVDAGQDRDAALAEKGPGESPPPPPAASCGNGTLDPGEECDDSVPKHRCPTGQNDCEASRDICWRWRVEGKGCHRKCAHAQGVCEDVLDPRDPNGLLTGCRNECPADTDVNNSWK